MQEKPIRYIYSIFNCLHKKLFDEKTFVCQSLFTNRFIEQHHAYGKPGFQQT